MDMKSDLIKNGYINAESVEIIKNWLLNEKIEPLTDEQIASFLTSNNNEVDLTKSTIQKYFLIRSSTPEIFTNRNLDNANLQKMLNVGYYCLLPKRTEDNSVIIVIKLQDYLSSNFDFESHLKLICMLLDYISFDNPPDALISMLDLEGATLMHLTHIKLRLVGNFTRYVQEGMPLKMKSVHLFNGGFVLKALFNIFKPFLNRKVKEMMHFHTNMDSFRSNWVSKEYLPEEYGGDLPCLQVHHEDTINKLNSISTYFDV